MIGVLIFLGLIPAVAFMALHVPRIQTWAAQKAVKKVESIIDGKASIDKITIVFYNRLILENVSIVGTSGDTLASIGKLSVNISAHNLLRKRIKVNRVIIDSGVFNFIEEGENKESNLTRIFKIKPKKEKKELAIPNMSAAEIRLKDFRFRYHSTREYPNQDPDCMNYADIVASDINARINRIVFKDGRLSCRIQKISAREKCGLNIKELKGDFSLDSHATTIENLILRDDYSNVTAQYLSFGYQSGNDLKDFINKISLGAQLQNTYLDFRTLSYFTPSLKKSTLALKLSGKVSGPISNMKISKMNITSSTGETYINISTTITGLPDINSTIFDAQFSTLYTTTEDISALIASFTGDAPNPKISSISPDVRYYFTGAMLGSISKLKAEGELSSDVGLAAFDIKMNNRGKKEGLMLEGNVYTKDLNIGNIIGNPKLGKASINTTLSATFKDKEYGGMDIRLDSLRVNRFGFNDYDYSNLFAVGQYSGKKFDGRIVCHDPNLHFMLQGVFSLSDITHNSLYNFYADISYADLAALNFDKKDEVSQVSLRTIANLTINDKKNILGDIDIKNLVYWNSSGEYEIGSISLKSAFSNELFLINLNAPFLTAGLTGTESPLLFINRLSDIFLYDHFGDVFTKNSKDSAKPSAEKGSTTVSLRTFNMKPICSMLVPGLYIADSTTFDLSLDEKNSLSMYLQSHRIGLKSNSVKGISMKVTNPDSLLLCTIKCDNINAAGMNIDNDSINVLVDGGVIDLKYIFANKGSIKNEMEFSSNVFFSRDSLKNLLTHISINESELYLQNYKWSINPCDIILGKDMYQLDRFSLFNESQSITADGIISKNPVNTLNLNMNQFDLSMLNAFIENDLQIKGFFTGKASVSDLYGNPNVIMDLKGNEVSIVDTPVGDLNILSKWDKTNQRIALLIDNKFEGHSPLNISGYFKPNGGFLSLNISLQDFALSYIEPFLDGVITKTSGSLTGDLELFGTLDKLNLTSYNTRFNNFSFTPVFTQVPYVLNGPVEMTESGINLLGVELKDQFGHTASISGGLSHRFFKDMYLDAKLKFKDLQCLDTREKDNSTFYGTAFGSGVINITGPFDDLFMDVTFATGSKTSIHVPLSGSSSATNKDLLSFVDKKEVIVTDDPYESGYLPEVKKTKSKFELNAKATITSETELFIEINKQLGDILKCKGNGTIEVSVNPARDILDLHGDYTIDEGSYKLVLLGITAKDFIINNGGSIGFNGGIMNTNLNVGATYRTKASISTLISDTSAVGNRRNVDCGIHMSGSLLNPNISFSIDVPDLDPITKGRVESALSTESKVQKQFMALLISGSFVPDEQSGIVNNTTILYSNAGEILSNQFNNVFRQLGIPLDLGLNYQPGEGKGNDMFDVALSYQAFNNRVVINGNIGNSQKSSSNWMGNFEAEVKLDKKGKMRLNAFTRSADDYSNYLDNTQRNGLGFTYQDEFDTFGELMRSIFYSKKRREAYETQQIIDAENALKKEAEDARVKKLEIQKPKESEYRYF